MDSLINTQAHQSSIYTDLQSLDTIRQQAKVNKTSAVKAAAKEFEAFFMNMMLKSMRQASEVIGDDSMFGSPQEKMFVSMLDEQMSVELSQKGNLGIANLMVRDLLNDNNKLPQLTEGNPNLNVLPQAKTIQDKVDDNQKEIKNNIKEISVNKELKIENQSESADLNHRDILNYKEVTGVMKAEKKSLFDSVGGFISQLLPFAKKASEKIGVDPKILLAQAALETGWGKYIMHDSNGSASHNLFGIKSNPTWEGASVNIDTLEVESGAFVKKNAQFRMYENFENSFSDYVNFLQSNPRYQSALEVSHDAKQFIKSLQSAGYATDPNYAKKVLTIFNHRMSQE